MSAGRPGDVFEPRFTTHGFRYVRIEGQPGALGPDDVTGVFVHTDLRRTGWFPCSDERVNRLHDAAVRSLARQRVRHPHRLPAARAGGVDRGLADLRADGRLPLRRRWLHPASGCATWRSTSAPTGASRTCRRPRRPRASTSPLRRLNGSAGWGDVAVAAPWDLYQAYGDESLLRECWGPARAWVDYAAARAAGERHPDRAAARPEPAAHEQYLWDAGFHWGEWLEPGCEPTDFRAFAAADKSEVATAYLHRSAATLARIAEVLGADAAVVARYRRLAAGARAAWQAEFVPPDGSLAVRPQASHVRALAFGLVPDELRARGRRPAGRARRGGRHPPRHRLPVHADAAAGARRRRPRDLGVRRCCCRTPSRRG